MTYLTCGLGALLAAALFTGTPPVSAVPSPGGPAGASAPSGHHGGHGDHHDSIGEFNWSHGFIGVKEGEPPSLLWRPPGTPPPFLATLLNYGVLFWVLYRFGAAPIGAALKKRKTDLLKGMEDAAKMRDDAQARLDELEEKLERIDGEIERVKREMREASERERERILSEARERRHRMEKDARLLVEQELKEARERLHRETVRTAIASAEAALRAKTGAADQARLADEYLSGLDAVLTTTKVGRA